MLLGQWLGERGLAEQGLEAGEALAIDGKRLCGIHGEQLPGVHLVAAYAHRSGVVLGQQAVAQKKNELEAVCQLLDRLDLQDRVVTGDAQFTQREVCRSIVVKGALPLPGKGQPTHAETRHCRPVGRGSAAPGGASRQSWGLGGGAAPLGIGGIGQLQRLAASGPGVPDGTHRPP